MDLADDIPYLLAGLMFSKYIMLFMLVNMKNNAWWIA